MCVRCVQYKRTPSSPWVAQNCSLLGLIGFFKGLQLIIWPLSALSALAGSDSPLREGGIHAPCLRVMLKL